MRCGAIVRVAAWGIFLLAILVLVILASGRARATNDPPPSGGQWNYEWTVTDSRQYAGCTITLGGNLTVAPAGRLDLVNARLVMDCSADGMFGIEVQPGGELVVRLSSNITSSSANYEYRLVVRADGKLTVSDSEIRECGYAWGSGGETAGMYLLSGSCNFSRALVRSGYYGVVARGASPSFADCRFSCNTYGAGLVNSSATFTNCTFDNNNNGANLEGCAARFTGCAFSFNAQFGVLAYTSPLRLHDCDLAYNTAGNCVLMSSDADIQNCSIRYGVYGVYASQGSPSVDNCTLFENRYGFYLYRCQGRISNCSVDHSINRGFSVFYGAPSVAGCRVAWTNFSAVDGRAYGTGIEAFSTSMTLSDCVIANNGNGMEFRYCSPTLVHVRCEYNDMGVWASQSSFDARDCEFYQNRAEGAFLTFQCTGTFQNCSFLCETSGLELYYHVSVEVQNSTFRGCKLGLRIEECGDGAVARGCIFDQNPAAATVVGSACRILGCSFSSNVNSTLHCDASSPDIEGNMFFCNTADAITLVDCGGTVAGNTFSSNVANGINLRGSGTDISNNTFVSNMGSGLYCFQNRSAPQVHNNTFRGNAIGISMVSGAQGRYWGNNITSNQLVGINLLDSDGEIFCNTVSGQTHGIACNYGSCPNIHGNNISGNLEGGLLCHVNSNATVSSNLLGNNTKFGISVLGSWPRISDNRIWGSLDGIVVDSSAGNRRVSLSGNRLEGNGWGVRATESVLDIDGCNFTLNWHTGAWVQNCSSAMRRSSFFQNNEGAYVFGGDITVEGCEFGQNNASGISTESTRAAIRGCFFFGNTDGVLDTGSSAIDVYDGTYLENIVGALVSGPGSTMEWRIEHASVAQNSWVVLAGNLTVYPGASLRLVNITLFMGLDFPAQRAIEVENGGRLEISQNSSVMASEPSNKFAFRLMAGGSLNMSDSRLQDCGAGWGQNGLNAGLHLMSSSARIRNVHFQNCSYGLIANGITASFEYLLFTTCDRAVFCLGSSIEIANSSVFYSGTDDFELSQGSRVLLVNTTFNRAQTSLAGPGNVLEVHWFLNINVAWQNKVLVQHASVALADREGASFLAGYTDEKGWLMWTRVLETRMNGSAVEVHNPYNISARLSNVTTAVDLAFEKSWTLYVTLRDQLAPYIEVLRPQGGAFLNYTPVVLSGRVHDFETGLEKVEVSTDGRTWQLAQVAEDEWSFLAQLADGNYSIGVRATDAVGNKAVATVDFTIKTKISVLSVESPAEGLLTRNPSSVVSGLTESGARIQVNGRTIELANGRFAATVFLSEGNNTIMITATDEAGNVATIVRSVILDTVAPFMDIMSPGNDSYVAAAAVSVSGRTEPGARVLADGVEILNSDGRFGQSVPLAGEVNILNITVVDAAGNANTTFLTVHVDMQPPGLEILFPNRGFRTERVNVTINGATEPFSTVSTGEHSAKAGPDGRFSMTVTLLYGNNTLLIKATDRAGNTNSTVWYVVRTTPGRPAPSPWLETIVLVALILAAENAYLLWRYRRKGPGAPAAAPGGRTGALLADAARPPQALPAGGAAAGASHPDDVPHAEILPSPDATGNEDATETVDMR